MVFHQRVLIITTTIIIHNFSVLILLNFNLIPSVSGNSDRLTESIKDTINILIRLYTRESETQNLVKGPFAANKKRVRDRQTDRSAIY